MELWMVKVYEWISYIVKELMYGKMLNHTQDHGEMDWCMVMEYCNGLMVDIMKDNLRMENNMVKELMFGKVKNILDNGPMVFRMVKEPISINKD